MSSAARPRLRDVSAPLRIDLAFVDALLRRQLEARRRGCTLHLSNVPDELRGLLELLGLDAVLALEPRGEAEVGEELRVDEVVQPRDPVA
jgi:ABC-type transporter Mla MlaB component